MMMMVPATIKCENEVRTWYRRDWEASSSMWQANTGLSQIQNMRHVNPFHPLSFDRFGFAANAESNARFSWFPEALIDGRPTKIRAVTDMKTGSYLGIIPGILHYGCPSQLGWLQGPNRWDRCMIRATLLWVSDGPSIAIGITTRVYLQF